MLPALAFDDALDGTAAYAVVSGECLLTDSTGIVAQADCLDLDFGEFGVAMSGSGGRSTLVSRVAIVVSRGAKPEMCRVDARRHVARVADVPTIGDRAVGQFIGDPVGLRQSSVGPQSPVAEVVRRAEPEPTLVSPCLGDFGPESRDNRGLASGGIIGATTPLGAANPFPNSARTDGEVAATLGAGGHLHGLNLPKSTSNGEGCEWL